MSNVRTKVVVTKYIHCDRCGEDTNVTLVRTDIPHTISFKTKGWEYVWDGKTYDYNRGSGADKRQFKWHIVRRRKHLGLCDDCWELFQEFWRKEEDDE